MKHIKLTEASLSFVFLAVLPMIFLAGCATTDPKAAAPASPLAVTVSKEAAARSQGYMDGADYLQVADAQATIASNCQNVSSSETWKMKLSHASACVSLKNWKVLRELGESLASSDIDSPWGAYFLSVAADETGDEGRAMWMIELAQKKVGGRSGLFAYQKARVLLKMKEVNGAITEMQRALVLEPRLVDGHLFLAEIYTRDLDMERATKYYQSALAIDPKNARALSGLAWVKQGAQDMDKRQPAIAVEASAAGAPAKPVLASEKNLGEQTGRMK